MTDSWEERRRGQEDSYFDKANKESLARLARKMELARRSPITGQPMEQIVAFGAVIDRCTTSGGIWLDAGELGQILAAAKESTASLRDFVEALPKLKPHESPVVSGLLSPDNGKPMKVDKVLGISIARCEETGGIWLDARELDHLITSSHQSLSSSVKEFFGLVNSSRSLPL